MSHKCTRPVAGKGITVKEALRMSLKTIYPSFPPIARGNPSVIKTDAKRERIIYANSRTVIIKNCLLYTSPSPRDGLLSRMPSSA